MSELDDRIGERRVTRYGREATSVRGTPGRATLTAKLPASARSIARAVMTEVGIAADAGAHVERAAAGGGAALPAALRGRFERSLGADLGGVRVHTGDAAAAASAALGARAYAIGQDIYMGAGQYRPETADGGRLLAHEVAHTVQQRGAAAGPQAKLEISAPGDALELEADEAAVAMMSGVPTRVHGGAFGVARVMRDPLPAHPRAHVDAEATPGLQPHAGGPVNVTMLWRGGLAASYEAFFATSVRDRAVIDDVVRYMMAHQGSMWLADGRSADLASWTRAIDERATHTSGPVPFLMTFTAAAVAYVEAHTHVPLRALQIQVAVDATREQQEHGDAPRQPIPHHAAPSEILGPEAAVAGSRASFHMNVTLGANDTGDDPLEASRQIDRGEFRWELFRLSDHAGADANAAETDRIAHGAGQGRAVTAADGHRDDLARIDHDASRDAARASGELADASAAHARGAQVVAATNILLSPVSLAARYGEHGLDRVIEGIVGSAADTVVPLRDVGAFIVRCTATPRTLDGQPSRDPSVAIKTIVVREINAEAARAFRDQDEQLELATAKRDLAALAGASDLGELERALTDMRRRLQSLPADAIDVELEHLTDTQRQADARLAQARAELRALDSQRQAGDYLVTRYRVDDLQDAADAVRDQLAEVRRQRTLAGARHALLGNHSFRPRAQIIDETSSDRLDLLWEMSMPSQTDGQWHCQLSDMTTGGGLLHHAVGADANAAVWGVIREFARMNQYGRGRLFVRLPEGVELPGVQRVGDVENAPGSTVLLRQRLADLGEVATAITAVTGVGGSVSMIAGAASSSINLAERLRNHTFHLDVEATTDLLTVLSAAATGATVIGRMRAVPLSSGGISLVPLEEAGRVTRAIGAVGSAADRVQTLVASAQLMQEYRDLQAQEDADTITPTAARTRRIRLLMQHVQTVHDMALPGHAEEHEVTAAAPLEPAGAALEPAGAEPAHPAAANDHTTPMQAGTPPLSGPRSESHGDPDHRDAIVPPAPVDPQPAHVADPHTTAPTEAALEPTVENATPTLPDGTPDAVRDTEPDPIRQSTPPPGGLIPTPVERAQLRELQRLVQATPTIAAGTQVVLDRTPSPLGPGQIRLSAARSRLEALDMIHADPAARRVLDRAAARRAEIHAEEGAGHFARGNHVNVDPRDRPRAAAQAFMIIHEADHVARGRAQPLPQEFASFERFRSAYMLHEAFAQASALDAAARAHLQGGGALGDLRSIREHGAREYFDTFVGGWNAYFADPHHTDERAAWMSARHAAVRALRDAFASFPTSSPQFPTYEAAARHAYEQGQRQYSRTEPPPPPHAGPAHGGAAHAGDAHVGDAHVDGAHDGDPLP